MADRTEQVTETRETTPADTTARRDSVADDRVPGTVLGQRIVYYIGGAIISLLALRFLLQLLAANQGNAFVDFVYGLSSFFVMPFWGIFGEPTYGQSQFETSTLVAIIVYALLTVGIAKLFTLGSRRAEV